jgi:hypothetical protein
MASNFDPNSCGRSILPSSQFAFDNDSILIGIAAELVSHPDNLLFDVDPCLFFSFFVSPTSSSVLFFVSPTLPSALGLIVYCSNAFQQNSWKL